MQTAVVILNWNTKGYLERFLPGLLDSVRDIADVVVADNASTDGSLQMLEEKFPTVRRIALDANYGFTGGYNRALAQVDAEYYVLLNSDVEVHTGWIEPLVEWMEKHPHCAVCGPRLHALQNPEMFEYAGAAGGLIDRYGYPFCRGRVLSRTEKDFGQYDEPENVLWVSGAAMMVRASVWKDLGGLDDRFFAHMEEIDFCWRAQRAGWRVTVVPESEVLHLGGGTLPQTSPWKLELNYRNNLLLLWNNLPDNGKSRRTIFTRMVLDGCSAMVYLITFRPACFKAVIKAHKGFRALRGPKQDGAPVTGCTPICILPQALVRRKKIFTYLRKYANSH